MTASATKQTKGNDALSIKQRTCQECGMLLDDAAEFHPYMFCVLKQAGRDPWADVLWLNERLGVDVTHWPKRPPLIRNLRA